MLKNTEIYNSNVLENVEQNMYDYIIASNQNANNSLIDTSNNLINKMYDIIIDSEKYLQISCNLLYDSLQNINLHLHDYELDSCNNLMTMYDGIDNYILSTSNVLMNYAYNMLSNLNLVRNTYTIEDIYRGDNILHVNFVNSNIIVNNFKNSNFLHNNYPYSLSKNNVYILNQNNNDNILMVEMMRKEGFVLHFVFKTKSLQDIPIYNLRSSTISIICVKISYGFINICIGYERQ